MPGLSTADHRVSPPRIDIPRDYNAAHDLIERNLQAGRSDKSAYIDDNGGYTYGELAERVNRCANALISLGLEPEQRVLLCILDTIDFPTAFLGSIKAGIVPIAANTLLTTADYRVHASGQPRACTDRLGAAAVGICAAARATPASQARDRIRARRKTLRRTPVVLHAARERRNRVCACGDDARRHVLLAVFVWLDRRAKRHRAHAFEPDFHGRALRVADPRHSRGRCRLLGGEAFFRLWARQRTHVSAFGRCYHAC